MSAPSKRRLSAAPLFVQVLVLVLVTSVAAQLVMATAGLVLERTRQGFEYTDVAQAIRALPDTRPAGALSVEVVDAPPAHWAVDDAYEQRARATIASLTGLPLDAVQAERRIYLPGGAWWVRVVFPAAPADASPPVAFAPDETPHFEELAVAARLPDGRWGIVQPPSPWLHHIGAFFLVLLLGAALLLVPLAWLFTRRVVAPIAAFADTAERAGRGDREATFPETGPAEIRTAARALGDMQRRIAGAVEERTRLIAAVAHDLRAPLMRLRFRAEDAPEVHRERMARDIERMDAMIAGVLAFARGEERLQRQRLDFAALVASLVDEAADTGAAVELASAQPAEVIGDALSLRRLVANLLDNAVKYGGGAHCRVERVGGDVLLHVEDRGPGLPDADLERVFLPFERGDAARDPSTGGIGLGLALARGIAKAHGGDVWLANGATSGLRAHVRLPAAAP